MVFDTEQQKQMVLALINSVTFSGKDVDMLYELKKEVQSAKIDSKKEQIKAP